MKIKLLTLVLVAIGGVCNCAPTTNTTGNTNRSSTSVTDVCGDLICGSSETATSCPADCKASTAPINSTLASISITPGITTIATGVTKQFMATGTYSNGLTFDLTSLVTWNSSNTTLATINTGGPFPGLATGLVIGSVNITANYGGINSSTASLTLTAGGPALISISLTPTTLKIIKFNTSQLTATGTYSDGTTANITSLTSWASSNTSIASTYTAFPGRTMGNSAGTANITATLNGVISAPASLTVLALISVAVTPTSITIPIGGKTNFVATGTYSDNSTGTITALWNSSNLAIATTSVNQATGVAIGSTTITATSIDGQSLSGTAVISVRAAVLTSISVTPNPVSIINATKQFTAIGTYDTLLTADITSLVTWNSSLPTIASISIAGLATGVGTGTTTITASLNSITSNNATLNVIMPTLITMPYLAGSTTVAKPISYFQVTGLLPNTTYTILVDNMTKNQDLKTYSDSTFTLSSCVSSNLGTSTLTQYVESCVVNSNSFGIIYLSVTDMSGLGGSFRIDVSGNNKLSFLNGDSIAELTAVPTFTGTGAAGTRITVTLPYDTDTGYINASIGTYDPILGSYLAMVKVETPNFTKGTAGNYTMPIPIPIYATSGAYQIYGITSDTKSNGINPSFPFGSKFNLISLINPVHLDYYKLSSDSSTWLISAYDTSVSATTVNITNPVTPSSTNPVSPACGTLAAPTVITAGTLPSSFSGAVPAAAQSCYYIITGPLPNQAYYIDLDQLNAKGNIITFSDPSFTILTCDAFNSSINPVICNATTDLNSKTYIRVFDTTFGLTGVNFRLTIQ